MRRPIDDSHVSLTVRDEVTLLRMQYQRAHKMDKYKQMCKYWKNSGSSSSEGSRTADQLSTIAGQKQVYAAWNRKGFPL